MRPSSVPWKQANSVPAGAESVSSLQDAIGELIKHIPEKAPDGYEALKLTALADEPKRSAFRRFIDHVIHRKDEIDTTGYTLTGPDTGRFFSKD